MVKTLDENWVDWESTAFGFGYGSGEPHVIPALKRFFELIPDKGSYDFKVLERELTPVVAWLLINLLCSSKIDMLEYGTSPRYAWLTDKGLALKIYLSAKTSEELVELLCETKEDTCICYPNACNCGPDGYKEGQKCDNPFWHAP